MSWAPCVAQRSCSHGCAYMSYTNASGDCKGKKVNLQCSDEVRPAATREVGHYAAVMLGYTIGCPSAEHLQNQQPPSNCWRRVSCTDMSTSPHSLVSPAHEGPTACDLCRSTC